MANVACLRGAMVHVIYVIRKEGVGIHNVFRAEVDALLADAVKSF